MRHCRLAGHIALTHAQRWFASSLKQQKGGEGTRVSMGHMLCWAQFFKEVVNNCPPTCSGGNCLSPKPLSLNAGEMLNRWLRTR